MEFHAITYMVSKSLKLKHIQFTIKCTNSPMNHRDSLYPLQENQPTLVVKLNFNKFAKYKTKVSEMLRYTKNIEQERSMQMRRCNYESR